MALSKGLIIDRRKPWIQFRLNKPVENGGVGGGSKQLGKGLQSRAN